jgi:cytochrome c oxidase assembly protein subunit 15
LSFGQFFPAMEGGVFYEHGHRMIAGTVGILTVILAIWLWRTEPRSGVRWLGVIAVVAVITQAVLGGITVLKRLPPPVSISHATLGQTFFCMMVALAVLTGFSEPLQRGAKLTKLQRLGVMTVGFIVLQLIMGATIRHTGKGVHAHMAGAVLVAVHVLLLSRRAFENTSIKTLMGRWAAALPLLLVAQIILGFIAWRTGPINVTVAHVAIGALIYAGSVTLTLLAFRSLSPSPLGGEDQEGGA